MLTRDLLRYDIRSGRIFPELIDTENKDLLEVAEELLAVFKGAVGSSSREELGEACRPIIEAAPFAAVIARGLEKLLLDRTTFDTSVNETLADLRQQVFGQTAEWLQKNAFQSEADYQLRLEKHFGQPAETLAGQLYADLPDYQVVTEFKTLSAERLLRRYNVAQVQALLLRCSELELTLADSGAPELRQLFKYLRFRQLLATICKDDEGNFRITVDGPLNLFYKTQKYGLNLALFFPAVLHQPRWQVRAHIQMDNRREGNLLLDETANLQPYSHRFLAYVPEEIRMFREIFTDKISDWHIEPADSFVPLEGEFYCFPDYALRHTSGKQVWLELFHPWHAGHLLHRLQQIASVQRPVLILGVAKALLKDAPVAQTLESSPYFENFGFTFREMPTVEQIRPVLGQVALD